MADMTKECLASNRGALFAGCTNWHLMHQRHSPGCVVEHEGKGCHPCVEANPGGESRESSVSTGDRPAFLDEPILFWFPLRWIDVERDDDDGM
jgi:hypothetical protein